MHYSLICAKYWIIYADSTRLTIASTSNSYKKNCSLIQTSFHQYWTWMISLLGWGGEGEVSRKNGLWIFCKIYPYMLFWHYRCLLVFCLSTEFQSCSISIDMRSLTVHRFISSAVLQTRSINKIKHVSDFE